MTLLSTLIFIKHFMYYSKTTEYADSLEHIMGCAFCNDHMAVVQNVEGKINTVVFQWKGITMVLCGWVSEPTAPLTGWARDPALPHARNVELAPDLGQHLAPLSPSPCPKSFPPGPLLSGTL